MRTRYRSLIDAAGPDGGYVRLFARAYPRSGFVELSGDSYKWETLGSPVGIVIADFWNSMIAPDLSPAERRRATFGVGVMPGFYRVPARHEKTILATLLSIPGEWRFGAFGEHRAPAPLEVTR